MLKICFGSVIFIVFCVPCAVPVPNRNACLSGPVFFNATHSSALKSSQLPDNKWTDLKMNPCRVRDGLLGLKCFRGQIPVVNLGQCIWSEGPLSSRNQLHTGCCETGRHSFFHCSASMVRL